MSLRRADYSPRGILPSVVRRCVWSSKLMNDETWPTGGGAVVWKQKPVSDSRKKEKLFNNYRSNVQLPRQHFRLHQAQCRAEVDTLTQLDVGFNSIPVIDWLIFSFEDQRRCGKLMWTRLLQFTWIFRAAKLIRQTNFMGTQNRKCVCADQLKSRDTQFDTHTVCAPHLILSQW